MKVLVFPYDKNPYQKLLYSAMRQQFGKDVKITYLWFLPYVGALHLPFELALRRLMGYRIVHIHWVAFYIRQRVPHQQLLSWYSSRFIIWWLKFLGYQVVWTVHDIKPHQTETIDDLDVSRRLSRAADLKIIHSSYILEQMRKHKLDTERCQVIPHGNYDGVYTPDRTARQARRELGIPADKTVVLFFGIIKTYKGVDKLLAAYQQVRRSDTVLVIAGKCAHASLKPKLTRAARAADIIVVDDYIPSEEVSRYFQTADVVCLPFRLIASSGSVLLALTFGKPIVVPRQGALNDIPLGVGYFYATDDKAGLQTALAKAVTDKAGLKRKGRAARRYADTMSWDIIAAQTYAAYQELDHA